MNVETTQNQNVLRSDHLIFFSFIFDVSGRLTQTQQLSFTVDEALSVASNPPPNDLSIHGDFGDSLILRVWIRATPPHLDVTSGWW